MPLSEKVTMLTNHFRYAKIHMYSSTTFAVFIWWVTRHLAANQQMNWLADMKFNSHHTTCHKLTYGYDFWILFSRPIFCTSRKLPMSVPIVSFHKTNCGRLTEAFFKCCMSFFFRLTNVYFHIWNDYLLLLCVFISMFRTFWWQKPQKYLTALNDKLLCQFFCDSIFFYEKKINFLLDIRFMRQSIFEFILWMK